MTFTEFNSPYSSPPVPYYLTSGPEGNLWFTTADFSGTTPLYVGRMTPAGVYSRFPVSDRTLGPITPGPDNSLWFREQSANKIARITPSGAITEFAMPTANAGLYGIAGGADGNVWFTEQTQSKIGRITLNGVITEFSLPAPFGEPRNIALGSDGNLWFSEMSNVMGRITPAGGITEFALPTSTGVASITLGSDGNLWFVSPYDHHAGHITTAGVATLFASGNAWAFAAT